MRIRCGRILLVQLESCLVLANVRHFANSVGKTKYKQHRGVGSHLNAGVAFFHLG